MSSGERDHLLVVRRVSSTQNEDDRLNRCSRICRALPLLIILTCICNAIPDGFMYSTSYFISPVSRACSPPWSKSATIYGSSAIAAGCMVGGFLAVVMHRTRLRLYFLIAAIAYSLVMGTAGAMVISCHHLMLTGEIIYIAMFGIYGIFGTVLYIANSELAISWMPQWPGFASGIHGMSQSIGSVFIPQMVIWLQDWFSSSHINLGTIFFCLGILKLILSAPWFPVVSLPHTDRRPDSDQSPSSRNEFARQIIRNYRFWLAVLTCFSAFLPLLAVLAVQEPLLITLWHEAHAPISTLSLILMGCYLAGRLLCLLYSDKVGLKLVWFLALLTQTVLLSCLGLLVLEPMYNSQKNLRVAVLCLYFTIFPVFKSTLAGLCHDIFGSQFRLLTTGVLSIVAGVAGMIGPVAIDAIQAHFNSYMMFFFGSAVLSVIGALALLAIRLPGTPHEAVSTIQDRTSETAANK